MVPIKGSGTQTRKWRYTKINKTQHKLKPNMDYVCLVWRGLDWEMLMEKGLPGTGASDHITSMT